jgi:hypothetical protein
MGFLDKVRGVVALAKEELDKTGVLDQLQPDRNTPGMVPSRDPDLDVDDAVRIGAVDPRTLITTAEVAEIVGEVVSGPELLFNGDFVQARFAGAADRCSVYSYLLTDGSDEWDVESTWEHILGNGEQPELIAGLGDVAARIDGYVWVKANGRVLFADVTGPEVDDARSAALAEAMLRRAVERL